MTATTKTSDFVKANKAIQTAAKAIRQATDLLDGQPEDKVLDGLSTRLGNVASRLDKTITRIAKFEATAEIRADRDAKKAAKAEAREAKKVARIAKLRLKLAELEAAE